jgi:hypothetical protein
MKRQRQSRADVVRELIALHGQGVPITQSGLRESGHAALAAAVAYFGGFVTMRRLARLAPPPRRARALLLDGAGVLREIRRRHGAGETLACTRVPELLRRSGERRFGSWKAALRAAGLDDRAIRLVPCYTDADLLELIRALARELPDMTVRELARHRLSSTLRDRFGSFDLAARRAGVPNWPWRRR